MALRFEVFAWNDENSEGFYEEIIDADPIDVGGHIEIDLSIENARRLAERLLSDIAEGNHTTLEIIDID